MQINQSEILLAALVVAVGDSYTPVQLQKYMFLLDKNLPASMGGPFFDFQPYDYGAFDPAVYDVAKRLASQGLVLIDSNPGTPVRTYAPTSMGVERGNEILSKINADISKYLRELSIWVRGMGFSELVSKVYQLYPETKVNSVFRG
jgi:hypothetical protein